MAKVFSCIFILTSLLLHIPDASAWSDDVEGVMMPSETGRDNMADLSEVMENLDESPDKESYQGPLISVGDAEEENERDEKDE